MIGGAAILGGIIDGTLALPGAFNGYQSGQLTGGKAFGHVAKEAFTGGFAAGTGAGAALLFSGGTILPIVAGVGVGLVAKRFLVWLFS